MPLRFITVLLLVPAFCSMMSGQDAGENPFKKAKIGDYLLYKTTIKGQPKPTTMKQTVVAVSEKEVTVELQINAGGKDFPPSTMKIDLTQKFDPQAAANTKQAEVKKLDEGKEILTINGKEYACTWIKNKITVKASGQEFVTNATTWSSKEIPMTGVAKVESNSDFVNSVMELVEFGSKK